MRIKSRKRGFAMLLVVIVVTTGVIMALAYISVAALRMKISNNFQTLSRARYLGESGIQHGLHDLLRHPDWFEHGPKSLGPFPADNSSDRYAVRVVRDAGSIEWYTMWGTGYVGDVRKTVSARVRRRPTQVVSMDYGLLVGSGQVTLAGPKGGSGGLTVQGNVHCNGDLVNYGTVQGDASATGSVSDPAGGITGEKTSGADYVPLPNIKISNYVNYTLDGKNNTAAVFTGDMFTKLNPLANGKAVYTGNMGGVVYCKPAVGKMVALGPDLQFTGTFVIDGDICLAGPNIILRTVPGFPAIVATGKIYVDPNVAANPVEIHGLVYAGKGFLSTKNTVGAKITIYGGLVSEVIGYDPLIEGDHALVYDRELATIYDLSVDPSEQEPSVKIVTWND